jgi:HD-like signal output (HDOD) protein
MLNRLIFVEADSVLREYYEGLSSVLGREYEVITAANGRLALDNLARFSADVVVSDLEINEMSGAEFLTTVERLYPETTRLVVSSHTEQLAVARCLMYGHRYLQKPLDPDFPEILKRICRLKHAIRNEKLTRIIGGTSALPTPPETYLRMTEALQSQHTSLADLAEIIRADLALTTKLLQVVNSVQFGAGRKIMTVFEAVQLTGIGVLQGLMLGIQAIKQYDGTRLNSLTLPSLWNHSLETAVAVRKLAQCENLDFATCEEFFVCGLLHDMGKLIFATHADLDYSKLIKRAAGQSLPVSCLEQEQFGATHSDVGAYLLGLWGLPESIVSSVQMHHHLDLVEPGNFSAVVAIYAAHCLGPGVQPFQEVRKNQLIEHGFESKLAAWSEALGNRVEVEAFS